MNGVPIAIRRDYLDFPVYYSDKSPWVPPSSPKYYESKTYADAITGFSVVVRWPTMEPHNRFNDSSWRTYRSSRPTDWISISAVSDLKPEAQPPHTPDNGLARILKGRMDDVVRWPSKLTEPDGQVRDVELRYELRGLDPALGLQLAVTVGRDADKPGRGNYTLYWRGDLGHIVVTSIACTAGINPGFARTCDHKFEMVELGIYVTVAYTENLLPQWQQVEAGARDFISSLRVDHATTKIR